MPLSASVFSTILTVCRLNKAGNASAEAASVGAELLFTVVGVELVVAEIVLPVPSPATERDGMDAP